MVTESSNSKEKIYNFILIIVQDHKAKETG